MMKIDCSTCQITLMIEPSANFSVFCPICYQTLYSESQSGYGAVTPSISGLVDKFGLLCNRINLAIIGEKRQVTKDRS